MPGLLLIRDPVHDYIPVTPIEVTIIDRPEFQRLRFVLQNSSAYLTYPGNTNTRFLHSLGVMYLSGLVFTNALQKSSYQTLFDFLQAAEKLITDQENRIKCDPHNFQKAWHASLGNACKFSHEPQDESPRIDVQKHDAKSSGRSLGRNTQPLPTYTLSAGDKRCELSRDPLYIINTLWQAVRLCALMHDVGHMPMSHVFEHAIEHFKECNSEYASTFSKQEEKKRQDDFLKTLPPEQRDELRAQKPPKLHELRGLFLFNRFFADIDYGRLLYGLAEVISLFSPHVVSTSTEEPPENQILRCLHGMVAGELDVDRLDYCVRDPLSAGLEFGAVDIQRIINNVTLRNSNGRFYVLPTDKALSAIESFFHQRYLAYKYLIYHHSVVRMDNVLKEILSKLIHQAYRKENDNAEIRAILDRYRFYCAEPSRADQPGNQFFPDDLTAIFDDAWLRTLLTEALTTINSIWESDNGAPIWASELRLLIDTFLYRQSMNLFSMWKRDTDYHATCLEIASHLGWDHQRVISLVPLTLGRDPKTRESRFQEVHKNVQRNVQSKGVQVLSSRILPKIHSEKEHECLHVLVGDNPLSITDASPYVRSLKEAAVHTADIHVAFLARDIKKNKQLQQECRNALIQALADYVKEMDAAGG